MDVDLGIDADARKQIADSLAALLADTSVLYLKTLGYHWNVAGPMFHPLHLMFEEQYVESETLDVIGGVVRG
jgi:starvation-inducible DNA-binding protein